MWKDLAEKMRAAFLKAYPDKFKSIEDLPLEKMLTALEEKGITLEEYRPIVTVTRFNYTLEKSGVKLEGKVLDLCSERISIASIYDKDKVVCYDFMTDIVKELKNKGIKAVQASIRDVKYKFFPFKNKSFDYLFCEGFPMAPYTNKKIYESAKMIKGKKTYVSNVIKEMIRVTKEKAIICSYPIMIHFPEKYEKKIEKLDLENCIIVLNCRKRYKNKNPSKK